MKELAMPIANVITIVVSLLVAMGGIVAGVLGKASADKIRAQFATLEARMDGAQTACDDAKQFQRDSAKDRADLHLAVGEIVGDVKVVLANQTGMSEKLDLIFKKIFNGGGK
jgi:hypothetical protein